MLSVIKQIVTGFVIYNCNKNQKQISHGLLLFFVLGIYNITLSGISLLTITLNEIIMKNMRNNWLKKSATHGGIDN